MLRNSNLHVTFNFQISKFSNLQSRRFGTKRLLQDKIFKSFNSSIIQSSRPTTANREQNKSVSCSPNTLLALCFLIPWRLRFFYRRFLPCIGGCAPNRWPSKMPFYCSPAMCFMLAGIGDSSSCCCFLRFWIISRACKYTKLKAPPKNGSGFG